MNEFAPPAKRVTEQGPDRGDELVAEYLDRVRAAAAGLDPGRREELCEDLSEHIAMARAELSPETEAGLRTLLDRLGDPAAIVAEASAGEPPAPAPVVARRSNRAALTVLIAVLALFALVPIVACVGGLLYFVPFSTEIQQGPAPVESPAIAPSAGPSAGSSAGPSAGPSAAPTPR